MASADDPPADHVPSPFEQQVVLAGRWAEKHRSFLKAVFDTFNETGDWPIDDDLQRSLLQRGLDLDVAGTAWQMPPSIGFVESSQVILTLRGLSYVPAARALLDAYVRLLNVAFERYLGDAIQPQVTNRDLVDQGLDKGDVTKVSRLLFREGWPFNGGAGEAERDWHRAVGQDVRHVATVQTIDDLLAKQAELRFSGPSENVEGADRQRSPTLWQRTKKRVSTTWWWRFLATEDRTVAHKIAVGVITSLTLAGIYFLVKTTVDAVVPSGPAPVSFEARAANVCDAADLRMASVEGNSPTAAGRRAQIAGQTAEQLQALVAQSPPAQRVPFEDYTADRYGTATIRAAIANAARRQLPTDGLEHRLQQAQYRAEADAKLASLEVCGERAPLE